MSGRLEKATFWATVSGVLVALAGIAVLAATVNLPAHESHRQPWLDLGITSAILALMALLGAVALYAKAHHTRPTDPNTTAAIANEIDIPAGSTVRVGKVEIILAKGTRLRVDGLLDGAQG